MRDERFEQVISSVFNHEGGYVNDISDNGGETKYGISKRCYPTIDIKSLTKEQAKAIYRKDFWEKYFYNKIIDINLASKVFNLAVNIGPQWAHRLLQRALRATGQQGIIEDGILGSATLSAVNSVSAKNLIVALKSEAAGYYRAIVAVRIDQRKFLNGWLNRAYS